jgi:hypothetical protein
MNVRMRTIGRRATVFAIAAIAVVALGGTALAGHIESGVKSYTGCLVTSSGTLVKIKEGDAPQSACTTGQVPVHFSGGDITAISAQAGGGLAVTNGANGAATLSIRRDCTNGEVVKWNGSAWACAADSDSTYTAGTGLDLTGSEFSVEPAYRVPGKACSASGNFARGFDSSGAIQCAAPATSVPSIWVARVGRADAPQVVSGTDGPIIASLNVPAGTYLLQATLTAHDDDGDDDVGVFCVIRPHDGGGEPAGASGALADSSTGTGHSIAISNVVTFGSAGEAQLRCNSEVGSDHVQRVTLTALRVATVN